MRKPNQTIVNKEAIGGNHAPIVNIAVDAAATSITSFVSSIIIIIPLIYP